MTNEPSIEEIVAELERQDAGADPDDPCDVYNKVDIRALIADWRKRGEALKPFVELADDRDGRYRKHGDNPDDFPDDNPSYVIKADELRLGVWRAARAARAPKP